MKLFNLIVLALLSVSAHAQLLECRAVQDTRYAVQFAKNQLTELRSANGTVYKRGGYNTKYHYTSFTAVTHLGIEKVALYDGSETYEGVEYIKAATMTEFKNGMTKSEQLLCYDVKQLNLKLAKEGKEKHRIIVKDY